MRPGKHGSGKPLLGTSPSAKTRSPEPNSPRAHSEQPAVRGRTSRRCLCGATGCRPCQRRR
eukprot:5509499-Alexandrium_andersonii.AAC.1